LTSWEHAATGKPQIVPDHSALPEIWGDSGIYVPTIADHVYEGTLTVARVVSTEGVVEKLEWAYQDWKSGGKELKRLGDMAYKIVSSPKHKWQNIAKKFDKVFDKVRNIHDNNLAE
jgi:glycosyltransferase involved in cell wall biosynthesis